MKFKGFVIFILVLQVIVITGCLFKKGVEDIAPEEVLKQYGSLAVNLKFDHQKIALKAPDGVEIIRLVVSGLDMEPMTNEFSASLETGVVDEIPIGNDRMILASGLDSSGIKKYQSISYADVTPNTQSVVDIDLLSVYLPVPPEIITLIPEIISISANFPDGFFKSGSVIDIIIEFSQIVNVTGIPQLELGDSIGKIDYVSGSGTTKLTFQYTVESGQNSAGLDYAGAGALTLNGGTLLNGDGVEALLVLPEPGSSGSLGSTSDIVIDTIAPLLSADSIVVNNTVFPNTVTATFSEKLDKTAAENVGNWVIACTSQEVGYSLSNAILGPDEKTVTISLIIPSSTTFSSYVTNVAALSHLTIIPSASIMDLAQNEYIGGQLVEAGATHFLDTTEPTVVTVYALDSDENGIIDTIEIEFSEAVMDSRFSGNQGDWLMDETGQITWDGFVNFSTNTSSVAVSSTADDKYVSLSIAFPVNIISTGPMAFQYIGSAIIDFAGNTLATIDATPTVDKAAPVLLSIIVSHLTYKIETNNVIRFIYSETMADPSGFGTIGDVVCSGAAPSVFSVAGFGDIVTDSAQAGTPISTGGTGSTYSLVTKTNTDDTVNVSFGTIGPLPYKLDSLGNGVTFEGTPLFEDIAGNKAVNKSPVNVIGMPH